MHGSTPARIRICHWENSYFIVPCLAALALLRNIRVTRLLMVVVTADPSRAVIRDWWCTVGWMRPTIEFKSAQSSGLKSVVVRLYCAY